MFKYEFLIRQFKHYIFMGGGKAIMDLEKNMKTSFKETFMVRIKSRLKFRWILCIVIFFLVLLIYGNHLLKERIKNWKT